MDIKRTDRQGVAVLALSGRLNQGSADALHSAAMEIAGDENHSALVVDMGGVDFIASVGIRSLIRPSQALSTRGGKLAVANLNPQIDEFFRLTGLDQMFRVFGTVDEAIDGISS